MKLFISIPVPPPVIAELIRLQRTIKALNAFKGSYVEPSNLHCTVLFIGLVEEEKVPVLQQQFNKLSFPAFEMKLNALDVNSLRHPHVLWITLDAPLLSLCAQHLAEIFSEYQDKRPFKGHITIARIKRMISQDPLLCLPVEPLTWRVEEIQLQESYNTREGVHYRSLASLKLTA